VTVRLEQHRPSRELATGTVPPNGSLTRQTTANGNTTHAQRALFRDLFPRLPELGEGWLITLPDPPAVPAELAGDGPPPIERDALLAFLADPALHGEQLRILLAILALSTRDGSCAHSVRQIAAELGRPSSSVGDHVTALVRAGFVTRDQVGRYRVRLTRTRPAHPDNPSGSPGQSVRLTRTLPPPTGEEGARAPRMKRGRRASTPSDPPAEGGRLERIAPAGHASDCPGGCDGTEWRQHANGTGLERCPGPAG